MKKRSPTRINGIDSASVTCNIDLLNYARNLLWKTDSLLIIKLPSRMKKTPIIGYTMANSTSVVGSRNSRFASKYCLLAGYLVGLTTYPKDSPNITMNMRIKKT